MVGLTIFSLLNQSYALDGIELNLSLKNFPNRLSDLPHDLCVLAEANKININWLPSDDKPFKKLIPTLKKYYPDDYYVITCDDDVIYDEQYVTNMLSEINCGDFDTFCPSKWEVIGNRMIYKSTIFTKEFIDYTIPSRLIDTCVDDTYIFAYLKHVHANMKCHNQTINNMIHAIHDICPMRNTYLQGNRIEIAHKLSKEIWPYDE